MATVAVRSQVAAKWQESFNRLNGSAPGISGLLNFSEAWRIATDFLYPRDIRIVVQKEDVKIGKTLIEARLAFNYINQCRRLPALLETFLDDLRSNFYLIQNEIKEYMDHYELDHSPEHIQLLVAPFNLNFQTRLFSLLPPSFSVGFKNLCACLLAPPSEDPDGSFSADSNSTRTVVPSISFCDPSIDVSIWKNFEVLGFTDRYEGFIASVCYEFIENYVLKTCMGEWAKPMLDGLRVWMSEKVVPWMLHVYARGATNAEEAKNMLQGVGSRFDFHINKTLCDLRTKEIFDIIIDFPDSMGALHDLRDCLQRVDQRANLVKTLRKANRKRLLHPGADTKLILSQYVATIKCLRIIDPPGVLLFKVADPIRRYLRERSDTIRSIVSNLVGDGDSGDSLVDENEPIQPLQQPEVEDYTDPNWEPEPTDAGPAFRTSKPSDVISTLVSIYDSKDLFVKELQVLLAQRLLTLTKDDTERVERERRNIEILKIRFGESALQVCEVMLKDMTDSKRIDGHVQSQRASIVHPTIISRHFWPSLETSEMIMPGQFQQLQTDYAHEFTIFKPDKKLKWLPHLGTVQLKLQLEDRVVDVDVPPLEAAFIELFSQKALWTSEELISSIGSIDRGAAIKALATWVDHGVLKEDPENTFILLEKAEGGLDAGVSTIPENPPISSIQQQQAEQMRVYWKFIEGMLTNLGTLPLDRIQTMLKFAPGYDRSIEQLALFMEAARREGLVVVRDGVWRLNK
ncbi:hypothetical protein BYT27DRAFT_7221469 [Phlegmacium glaucopus]|nr:hypothetical protein BYT27DRAFT_7221469 [Phlegmacium glaucopus]